ncbi:MAG: hypothetical protein LUG61_06290 [Lachnospiraceae bacterium]|nr:hypothetical protein [Lachnospiraceae bacterium]
MKYNILTFLTAALMVAVSTLALTSGMWIYEHNKLEAEEMRTPTTISSTMSTIYSDSAQNDTENETDPTYERIEDIEEERDGGSGTEDGTAQEGDTGD